MKNRMIPCLGGAFFLATLAAAAGHWPAWRGPEGTGVTSDRGLVLSWATNENVRWRVALPGPGNSSPIVWGNRVFVTQSVRSENRRTVMCFARTDGKLLWQSGLTYTDQEPSQESNPYCSGSPVTDGERVYVCFGSAGVCAYDFEGKETWRRDLGKLSHRFGNAVSPVLAGDLCILHYGPDEKARLIALDKATGRTVWEAEPPKPEPSELQQDGPGGRGGPGGPGGRGGFGPGVALARQVLVQADTNNDGKLTAEEFAALADAWFDKLDPDRTGKLSQERFVERSAEFLSPAQGSGPPGEAAPGGAGTGGGPGAGPGARGFGPGRFVATGLFTALDADKDGSLNRTEIKETFRKWFTEWDSPTSGALGEDKVRDGLNAALPRPNFGGPGDGRGSRGPGGPGGGGAPSGSWSTPIIIRAEVHEVLVVSTPCRLAGYDPKTGKQLWLSKGIGGSVYASPVWGDGALVAMSGGPGGGSAIAVRPGGNGDVTESQRLWRQERVKSSIGSGVIHAGHLYTIGQDGVAECRDLKTGERVWEERMKGPGAKSSSWSSLLLAGDRLYAPNQAGDVFVFRAGPKFELLAVSSLNEPTNASLAASDGCLFLRTDASLWCLASSH